jgi:hypothetical protein
MTVTTVAGKLLVGAPGNYACNLPMFGSPKVAGRVYLFDAESGELLQRFQSPAPQKGDLFGWSIATVGEKVVIGAPGLWFWTLNPARAGQAFVFDRSSGNLIRKLQSPTPTPGDCFGISAAAIDNNFAVGACGLIFRPDRPLEGRVYLFDGATGVLLKEYRDPKPSQREGPFRPAFAMSVAACNGDVLVPGEAAYLFRGVAAQTSPQNE